MNALRIFLPLLMCLLMAPVVAANRQIPLTFASSPALEGHAVRFEIRAETAIAQKDRLTLDLQFPLGILTESLEQFPEGAEGEIVTRETGMHVSGGASAAAGWNITKAASEGMVRFLIEKKDTVRLGPDAPLILTIPLQSKIALSEFPIRVSSGPNWQELGNELDVPIRLNAGALVKVAPVVRLDTDQESPTALELGKEVKISWIVENGVSGKLIGPLPNGSPVWELRDGVNQGFTLKQGSITVRAVSRATYMLDAIVHPSGSDTNTRVVKWVTLDLHSARKLANLAITPATVLPFGDVDVNWAAWGVSDDKAKNLKIVWTDAHGYRQVRLLPLQGAAAAGQFGQGTGTHTFQAAGSATLPHSESVRLEIGGEAVEGRFEIARWEAAPSDWMTPATGTPKGLAYAGQALVLCTADGLWISRAGAGSSLATPFAPLERLVLKTGSKSTVENAEVAAWLGLTAAEGGFAALRRLKNKNIELVHFAESGAILGTPITVSAQFQKFDDFWLVSLGNRVYVRASLVGKATAIAYSYNRLEAEAGRSEGELEEKLLGMNFLKPGNWKLMALNGALYALEINDGQLFNFEMGANRYGSLNFPKIAEKNGKEVNGGMLMNAGGVLVLVRSVVQDKEKEAQQYRLRQDRVYNPQTNKWMNCGHGLDIPVGALAAYRDGIFPRLWVIDPEGKASTLAVDSPRMFSRDYFSENKALPIDYFGEEFSIELNNQTGQDFYPEWESDTPMHVTLPAAVAASAAGHMVIRYDGSQSSQITLRNQALGKAVATISYFGVQNGRGRWEISQHSDLNNSYVLEVEDLKRITLRAK